MRPMYEPLNAGTREIRVLVVEPAAHFEDPLTCSLQVVSLAADPLPCYATVSYCWGDATIRGTMILPGVGEVDVPASSAAAIQRMRHHAGSSRVLWLDAICINQEDVDERNSQVAMMGQIYRLAQGNLIYLGEDVAGAAPKAIETLSLYTKRITDAGDLLTGEDLEDWENGHIPNCWDRADLVSTEDIMELESLYTLRWFTRLWIVQEAALARTNTCFWGDSCFQLEDALLVANVWLVSSTGNALFEDLQGLTAASYMRRCAAKRVSSDAQASDFVDWSDVFSLGAQQSAFDRRDHVFALSGLTQAWRFPGRELPELIQPDYRKSVEEVFRDATRLELEIEDDYILGNVNHWYRQDLEAGTNKPSWSVEWDRASSYWVMPPHYRAGRQPLYDDEIPQGLGIQQHSDSNVLNVKGFLLGPIVWDSTLMLKRQLERLSTIRLLAKELSCIIDKHSNDSISIASKQGRIALLLTCGNLSLGTSDFLTETAQLSMGLASILAGRNLTLEIKSKNKLSENEIAQKFHRLVVDKAEWRTFFSTADGHFGSGPLLTLPGDMLFIMQGGCFAHILRPKNDYYLYVGAAYVPGLMAGEVFELDEKAQWINIR